MVTAKDGSSPEEVSRVAAQAGAATLLPAGLVGIVQRLRSGRPGDPGLKAPLDRFLAATSLQTSLGAYFALGDGLLSAVTLKSRSGPEPQDEPVPSADQKPRPEVNKQALLLRLGREIAQIDALLTAQVNAIIHHPRFQQLEASWRGLRLILEEASPEQGVRVRMLSLRKAELYRDLDSAASFDQSELFRRIYRDEFKTPGGEPFGALIGDYEFSQNQEDIFLLRRISEVAALSFCPFIAGAAPRLFGLSSFAEMEHPRSIERTLEGNDWMRLRRMPEAMFLGLTLPRVLLRLPYGEDGPRDDGFDFQEEVAGPDANGWLWGNAAYAFAKVLVRAYIQTGWLAQIRGVTRDEEDGGLLTDLPAAYFSTDRPGVAPRCPTDIAIADTFEQRLAPLGVIPLCHCQGTEYCAFYSCASLAEPKTYDDSTANANARISAMLQYVLCAARFAHYINVMTRDWIGRTARADELQSRLNDWLQAYVLNDPEAEPSFKAERPLRTADCEVRQRRGNPGAYDCIVRLQPHYQLDTIAGSIELKGLRIDAVGALRTSE